MASGSAWKLAATSLLPTNKIKRRACLERPIVVEDIAVDGVREVRELWGLTELCNRIKYFGRGEDVKCQAN